MSKLLYPPIAKIRKMKCAEIIFFRLRLHFLQFRWVLWRTEVVEFICWCWFLFPPWAVICKIRMYGSPFMAISVLLALHLILQNFYLELNWRYPKWISCQHLKMHAYREIHFDFLGFPYGDISRNATLWWNEVNQFNPDFLWIIKQSYW